MPGQFPRHVPQMTVGQLSDTYAVFVFLNYKQSFPNHVGLLKELFPLLMGISPRREVAKRRVGNSLTILNICNKTAVLTFPEKI